MFVSQNYALVQPSRCPLSKPSHYQAKSSKNVQFTFNSPRHKARKHKLRRCRFRAVISAMFNYRCCLSIKQVRKRGKYKMVALVAVMRKLICILNTMVKNNQEWNPNLIKIA